MSLSPEIVARLEAAHKNESVYVANERRRRDIGSITLISTVGPSQAGKTTVAELAEQLAPGQLHNVITTTTRGRKNNEGPTAMDFRPHEDQPLSQILDDVEQGEVVQYAVHPTKGQFYGTYIDAYRPDRINIMPTLTTAINGLRRAGFRDYRIIAVVPDIAAWQHAFAHAPHTADDRLKRLREGEGSLQWLLEHADEVQWLHNPEGRARQAAQHFLDMIDDPTISDREAQAIAVRLLQAGVQPLLRRAEGN